MLLASHRWRPEMLLNMSPPQGITPSSISTVVKLGNPTLEDGVKKRMFLIFYINTILDFNNLSSPCVQQVFIEHLIGAD